jgi:mannose-1-phosphate guanylyltransferase
VIDGGSSVGAGVRIGAKCIVRRAIVMPNALIGAGSRVEASVVGAGAQVGAGAVLVDVVLADGATVPPDARPAPGSRMSG